MYNVLLFFLKSSMSFMGKNGNLVTAVRRLYRYLQVSSCKVQQEFIKILLHGKRASMEVNFAGLGKQIHRPNIHELTQIKKKIAEFIHSKSHSTAFINCLNEVSDDINAVIDYFKEIRSKNGLFTPRRLRIFNELYSDTENCFHGKIILPLSQAMDFRLGSIPGACVGYVLEWIRCLLLNKNPFGINPTNPPFFKPLKYRLSANQYLSLNHTIPINLNVFDFQNTHYDSGKLSKRINNETPESFEIQSETIVSERLFHHSEMLAKDIIKNVTEFPDRYFYFSMANFAAGHAMGFGKDENGSYHFIDANSGWYLFADENNFQQWLSYYFKQMGYAQRYCSYEITSYELIESKLHKEGFNTIIKLLGSVVNEIFLVIAIFIIDLYQKVKLLSEFSHRREESLEMEEIVRHDSIQEPTKDDHYPFEKKSLKYASNANLDGLLDLSPHAIEHKKKQMKMNSPFWQPWSPHQPSKEESKGLQSGPR